MPTTRPRHQVTETPEVERALDLAAKRWPGESRGRLLVRLVEVGIASLEDADAAAAQIRQQMIDNLSGSYADAFPDDHLDDLRQDWPE